MTSRTQGTRRTAFATTIENIVWDQTNRDGTRSATLVGTRQPGITFTNSLDREAVTWYPAGSFLYIPGDAVHFDGAEKDTVLLGTAVGPWSTDYLDS